MFRLSALTLGHAWARFLVRRAHIGGNNINSNDSPTLKADHLTLAQARHKLWLRLAAASIDYRLHATSHFRLFVYGLGFKGLEALNFRVDTHTRTSLARSRVQSFSLKV